MLFLFVGAAHAAVQQNAVVDAGWNKLTASQQAELLKSVADGAASNKPQGVLPTVEKAKEYAELAEIGPAIAQTVALTAKELNIAVNEFVGSPVGTITMVLIVWHFLSGMMFHLLAALVVLSVGAFAMRKLAYVFSDTEVTYDTTKTNWFGNHPITSRKTSNWSDSESWGFGLLAFITCGFTVLCLLTI